jgi:type I restriction enzyme, S subunit
LRAISFQALTLKVTVGVYSDDLFNGRVEGSRENEEINLGEVCKLQSGYPFKSSEFISVGDRLLRGSNVGVKRLDWSSDITRYFPAERRDEFKDYVLRFGDIVVAMDRPFIGEGFKIARIAHDDLPALLLQRVGRFLPSDKLLPDFLWMFLQSASFQNQLRSSQQGTDLPHISRFDVESTKIRLPSITMQKHYIEEFRRFECSVRDALDCEKSYSILQSHLLSSFFG